MEGSGRNAHRDALPHLIHMGQACPRGFWDGMGLAVLEQPCVAVSNLEDEGGRRPSAPFPRRHLWEWPGLQH